jgi:hypothetical protein
MGSDGSVRAPAFLREPTVVGPGRSQAEVFAGRIDAALRAASEADEEAAGKLRQLTPEATAFAPPRSAGQTSIAGADIPGRGAPPKTVATWRDGLSPMQKESAIGMSPDKLGELDGIPTELRDRCNRELLSRAKAKLAERERFPPASSSRTSRRT